MKRYLTATDNDIAYAKLVIDQAFNPALKRLVDNLNQTLSKRNIRAGVEVQFIFDRFEIEPDETTEESKV